MSITKENMSWEINDPEGTAEWQSEVARDILNTAPKTRTFVEWEGPTFTVKNHWGDIDYIMPVRYVPQYLEEHPDDPNAGLMEVLYNVEFEKVCREMRPTAGHVRSIFTDDQPEGRWLTTVVAYGRGNSEIKEFRSTLLTSSEDVWEHVLVDTERALFADVVSNDRISNGYRRLWIECLYAKQHEGEPGIETLEDIHDDENMKNIMAEISGCNIQ